MPFVYIGRTHNFVGKSIWEICCSLKNFGVGRMVIRQRQLRYPEPCFMRIVKAEPFMDEDNRKGEVIVEQVFRGKHMGEISMSRPSYKTDYQLIPKHEEYKFIKAMNDYKPPPIKIYDRRAEMTPLLKLIAETRGHSLNYFEMNIRTEDNPRARVAEEGETPNIKASYSLGTPVYKGYYEGVLEKYSNPSN